MIESRWIQASASIWESAQCNQDSEHSLMQLRLESLPALSVVGFTVYIYMMLYIYISLSSFSHRFACRHLVVSRIHVSAWLVPTTRTDQHSRNPWHVLSTQSSSLTNSPASLRWSSSYVPERGPIHRTVYVVSQMSDGVPPKRRNQFQCLSVPFFSHQFYRILMDVS